MPDKDGYSEGYKSGLRDDSGSPHDQGARRRQEEETERQQRRQREKNSRWDYGMKTWLGTDKGKTGNKPSPGNDKSESGGGGCCAIIFLLLIAAAYFIVTRGRL